MTVSKEFYDSVHDHSIDSKRRVSMEHIKEACDALSNNKNIPFTVSDIGRYCDRQFGGPKTQSIRNSADVLEKYSKLRIAEHTQSLQSSPNVKNKEKYNLNLANPALAQQQYLLAMAEIDELRKEVRRLKEDIKNYAPLTSDQLLDAVKKGGLINVDLEDNFRLPQKAVNALSSLLNENRLKQCELTIDHNGYLINVINGNELLTSKEVAELKALVKPMKTLKTVDVNSM